jgi:putative aldouronate transport system permease protein
MKRLNARKLTSYREFLYILPFLMVVAVFSYYPLYGWFYSFFDFKPPKALDLNTFVGFKWFFYLVNNSVRQKQIMQVLINTFALSGLNILFSWLPMIFAIFLNEIKSVPFRKVVQTVTTIPNFISWVLVYSIAYNLFNSTGMMNTLLQQLGLISTPIQFLQSADNIWFKMWAWGTWKNLGWAAIMYMAAISGIDEELNEAARVDGATRLQIIRHITIPCLLPTFFVLLMLQIANFLSNGMEQYYVFQNSFNKNTIQGLDLYVYNLAMGSGSYSVSTALSMLKSLISVALLCGVNGFSKLIRGESFI